MYLAGAQTSTKPVPFSFRTQWYTNLFTSTHGCLNDEHFMEAARVRHSNTFLGQLSTFITVARDDEHGIPLVLEKTCKSYC